MVQGILSLAQADRIKPFAKRSFLLTLGLLASALSVGNSAQASPSYSSIYEKLKNSGINFKVHGRICEEVARLMILDQAPGHIVLTGIPYGDSQNELGELDVVKFKWTRHGLKAVTAYEVKCWPNLHDAYLKASQQKQHFFEALRQAVQQTRRRFQPIWFGRQRQFTVTNFAHDLVDVNRLQYVMISQAGGENEGFETLPFTREQLMNLREDIMSCQVEQRCLRPPK